MRTLPIYKGLPLNAIDGVLPLERDDVCSACKLCERKGLQTRCMPADGKPGGLLVIGGAPEQRDDDAGRPFVGAGGALLRRVLASVYDGPVAFAYSVGCCPGKTKVAAKTIAACRPYLANVIAEVQPSRVVLLGTEAAQAVLGRTTSALFNRGGYSFLSDGTPVFFLMQPFAALRNAFVRKWFVADLANAFRSNPPLPPLRARALVVETHEDMLGAIRELKREPRHVMFDVETAGAMFGDDFRMLCLSFAVSGADDAYVVGKEALRVPEVVTELRSYLEDPFALLGGQNVKYDQLAVLASFEARIPTIVSDIRLIHKMLDPEAEANLDRMGELVGMGGSKAEARTQLKQRALAARKIVAAYDKTRQPFKPTAKATLRTRETQRVRYEEKAREATKAYLLLDPYIKRCIRREYEDERFGYALLDDDVLYRYNALDSIVTGKLDVLFGEQLRECPHIKDTWERTVRPASMVMARMEENGIEVSRERVDAFDAYLAPIESDALARLSVYGPDVNWNAPGQIAELLYGTLGLKCSKQTKGGGESTDDEALKLLEGKHPIVGDITLLRSTRKLRGTYAVGLARSIRPGGRVHCNYKLDGARSGRPSATDPNLLNIPRADSPEGAMIRGCFGAPPGKVLIELDESQVELRVAAALSDDPLMRQIFIDGHDYHLRTAQLVARDVWGLSPEEVDSKHRTQAKCFHTDTEVLTRTGWQRIVDLREGEQVVQAEPTSDGSVRLSWATPLEVFTSLHPSGELEHLYNEGIDLRVTPDHRMLGWSARGKMHIVSPEEFTCKALGWANSGVLNGVRRVDEALLRLAVATQADGSITKSGAIRFGFSRQRKIERIARLLNAADIPFKQTMHSNGKNRDTTAFRITAADAAPVVTLLDNKRLPWWWLQLCTKYRKAAIDELVYWDSCKMPKWRMFRYSSTIEQNVDVAQAIAASIGRKTRKVSEDTGSGVLYGLTVRDRAGSVGGSVRRTVSEHHGAVACIAVPSTFVLVRDGGVPVICGQTVNFQTLYGGGPGALAKKLGISKAAAAKLQDAIMGTFTGLAAYRDSQLAYARKHGYVWTMWDGKPARRRPLWNVASADEMLRSTAENGTLNTPVQGTASDVCMMSLVAIQRWIDEDGLADLVRIVLTVYDSIMLEVRHNLVDEVVAHGQHLMTQWPMNGVPLVADAKVGPTWGSMVNYDKWKEQNDG